MQNINGIDFLTTQEVAEIKGVCVKTVQKWLRRKMNPLPSVKIGDNKRAQYLVKEEDLNNFSTQPVGRPKNKE